ncbi:MAG: transketolase family protein, partial [Treponema sp.]|nr:transketolase family protein [Treponema sp.]
MSLPPAKAPTRRAIMDRLVEAAKEDPDFVVLDSDIGYSTYSYLFGDAFP